VLATPPVSEEVWLQTLHSQFHLALCAGIILTMQTEAPFWQRWFRIALLALERHPNQWNREGIPESALI
jgi:hypothetical protein